MWRYVCKRFILAVPVLIGATFLVFTIMYFAPGDPARMILGSSATEEAIENLREELGVNDPFIVQYGNFMKNLLHGSLGNSYRNGQPITKLIMGRLANTVVLASVSIIFAVIVGVIVGVISAVRQYSVIDNITMFFTLVMTAIPTFWFGLILVIIFSVHLGWLPASGMGRNFTDFCASLVLPVITLGGAFAAVVARTTRSSVLEVIHQDYITMARAKGLTESRVIWGHVMKNAMIPILTVVGLYFGVLLGGSVITESVFSWPGVGRFVVESISYKDTPAVLGSVVTLAILFTLVNLIVDLLYACVDPRIKSQYKNAQKKVK